MDRQSMVLALGLVVVLGCASAGAQPAASDPPALGPDVTATTHTIAATDDDGGRISVEEARVERALAKAFGDPLSGAACRSIAEAREVAEVVLQELGLADWSIEVEEYARDEACGTAFVRTEGKIVLTTTMYRPEVSSVLETFREHSLAECLDADTAIRELTEALEAVGHHGFAVRQGEGLAGPGDRWAEITAHAAAGCVFYTFADFEEDGSLVYLLSGG